MSTEARVVATQWGDGHLSCIIITQALGFVCRESLTGGVGNTGQIAEVWPSLSKSHILQRIGAWWSKEEEIDIVRVNQERRSDPAQQRGAVGMSEIQFVSPLLSQSWAMHYP